jgi:hypothetical protein
LSQYVFHILLGRHDAKVTLCLFIDLLLSAISSRLQLTVNELRSDLAPLLSQQPLPRLTGDLYDIYDHMERWSSMKLPLLLRIELEDVLQDLEWEDDEEKKAKRLSMHAPPPLAAAPAGSGRKTIPSPTPSPRTARKAGGKVRESDPLLEDEPAPAAAAAAEEKSGGFCVVM